jgi:hypothetical protein
LGKLKITQLKKLCQVTNNIEWKKNRNLHAICILDMLLNNKVEEPYSKFPPDGPVAIISKSIVKSRLSSKFMEITSRDEYRNNNPNVNEEQQQNENLDKSAGTTKKARVTVQKKEIDQTDLDALKGQINKLKDELTVLVLGNI